MYFELAVMGKGSAPLEAVGEVAMRAAEKQRFDRNSLGLELEEPGVVGNLLAMWTVSRLAWQLHYLAKARWVNWVLDLRL